MLYSHIRQEFTEGPKACTMFSRTVTVLTENRGSQIVVCGMRSKSLITKITLDQIISQLVVSQVSVDGPGPLRAHDDVIKMETFSTLLALCAGNSPVPGEFPAQRPVTRSFDGFFYLRPNKRLSKQCWVWLFETPSSPLWRHCNANIFAHISMMLFGTCVDIDPALETSTAIFKKPLASKLQSLS